MPTPEELSARVEQLERENATLHATLEAERQEAVARDAAELLGWNPTVLTAIVAAHQWHLQIQETAGSAGAGIAGAAATRSVFVRPAANAAGPLTALEAAVRDAAPDFLPALEAEPRSGRARLAPGHASARAVSDELKATHRAAAGRSSAYELL